MTYLLAGDIGGTKTILRLVESDSEPQATVKLKTIHEQRYISAEYRDLVPIVNNFLIEAAEKVGTKPIPEKACFAIAGPIVNNTVKLTNLSWMLNALHMEQALGISQIRLINDFEAIGYGVLGLTDDDMYVLQAGETQPDAPMAVIGAGTGLGECFLVCLGNTAKVYPTEGGHTDFAPRSELEFELLKYLLAKHSIDRVSVERVVSGLGLISIYQFLRDRDFAEETPEIAAAVRTWEKEVGLTERTVDPGAFIGKAALERSDRLSEETMQIFIEAYGAEAGNLALKTLPFGGLYIAGGIAPKILPLLKTDDFMTAFTNKGRMSPLLERMPVRVITNPQVGLIGAAIRAANL
ncbi:MAG: glucokinase [Cyanobacteriota bacterium]|nr:glucokinase [Cyanobacteriota bacterium]